MQQRRSIWQRIVLIALSLALSAFAGEPKLNVLTTVDVPGHTAEIVGYCPSEKLLVATNSIWDTLDIFEVDWSDRNRPKLKAIDFSKEYPSNEGVWTMGTPTSVAVHPTLPIALVVALNEHPQRPGMLLGIDLRRGETLGHMILLQDVGIHPDSIAISSDGRWALIANEGEYHPDTPGTLTAVDLKALAMDRKAWHDPLASYTITGLDKVLETPVGDVEPEFVAFDPQGRFAVVSCQENDAVVLVEMRDETPRLAGDDGATGRAAVGRGVIFLEYGSEPDGVDVIDGVALPPGIEETQTGHPGCLVAVAEEGKFDRYGRWLGNAVSLWWVNPDDLTALPRMMARVDIAKAINEDKPDKRRDPEAVVFKRWGGKLWLFAATERGDRILAMDVTNPTKPQVVDIARVGDRPEGMIDIEHDGELILITGDEGNEGPGEISFTRFE